MIHRNAIATVDLSAIAANLSVVKKYAPKSQVMCAVKANAYGHGLLETANALQAADGFAVAHIREAIALREAGMQQVITVLQGPAHQYDVDQFEKYKLCAVIHHKHQLVLIEHSRLTVWLKINTGMNRLGFAEDQAQQVIEEIKQFPTVKFAGLFTHMANSDRPNSSTATTDQLDVFNQYKQDLKSSVANSATLVHWQQAQYDWVRPGIMLYGINPFSEHYPIDPALRAAMTLTAPVIAVNTCKKNATVGYGSTWRATRDSTLAVIGIGYGDGYPRHAKNDTPVLIHGKRYPLVGRVSMDLITVDITDLSTSVSVGDIATLWGSDAANSACLPIECVAEHADTIAYELLCAVYGKVAYRYTNHLNSPD